MSETLKDIACRYSCRAYKANLPEESKIRAVAEAAVQSPSGNNSQRWRVVVVREKGLLNELEQEALRRISLLPDGKQMHERFKDCGIFYGAPVVIFVPISQGGTLDAGIVCQNISLAAQAQGLGSCICGLIGFAFSEEKADYFKEKLGFPEGFDFGCSVIVGEAANVTAPHAPDYAKISYID
ncbi:nitroreductase [Clostridia bacterium]|nr:nitroreductase [Clostridia bacterium]